MPDREVVDVIALAAMAGGASDNWTPPVPGGFGSSPPGGMGVTSQGFGQEGYVLDSSDIGPRPRPLPQEENFAVGVPYYLPFTTPYRDSWEIFRDDPVTIRQLIGMLRQDGQARALFRLVTMPILASLHNAVIRPPEHFQLEGGPPADQNVPEALARRTLPDEDSGAREETEYIHNLFFLPASAGGMTRSFSQVIRRMLLAVIEGFSAFEMIYWVPKTGPMKNKVTLRKIDWRPSETITFLLDGQGEFNGFRQRTFFQGRTIDVKIPKDRAFYFANGEEERPFYGVSLFESAFYHYDKKTKLYYIVHLAAQRAAVGTRVGTMPPNPAKQDKVNFVNAMRDLGMSQYIVVPSSSWTVESLNESQGRFDYLGLINHHNSQMSKSVLAEWFDNDQGKGVSESTLVDFGTQNDETFMMMEQAIMADMERCVNEHIIPRFIDWNFGTSKYPEFHFGTLTEEQQSAVQDTFDKLATAPPGAVSGQFMMQLEKRMAKMLGLSIDYGPIERQAMTEEAMRNKLSRSQMEAQLAKPGPPGHGAQPVLPPEGAGASAGVSAGISAAGGPPGSKPGQGAPPSRPPQPPGSTPQGLAARDQAMVALVAEILEGIVTGREEPEHDAR